MPIHTIDWDRTPPSECWRGAVSVGNFDGVHVGHQELVRVLRQRAQQVRGPAVAVTFDPHPLQILKPEHYQPALTTIPDRAELLQRYGADQVVVLRTIPDLLAQSPSEFFESVIVRCFAAGALVEGPDFRFGHQRRGNVAALRELCGGAGVAFDVVSPVARDGVPVSSSRVRRALLAGDAQEAAALLNRPYALRGTVVPGAGRGRALGFPTANLEGIRTVVPRDGVYAVVAGFEGRDWRGAANIGPNPTFGEQARKVEIHLVGFEGDLTRRDLVVWFMSRIRDTRRFASAEALAAQIRSDIEHALELASGKEVARS